MSGKKKVWKPFSRERFKLACEKNNISWEELGDIRATDTLKDYCDKKSAPADVVEMLSERLNVTQAYLSGEVEFLRPKASPVHFPYALDGMAKIKVEEYYYALLAIHGISINQFKALEPRVRFELQHRIESNIVPVLSEYFPESANGQAIPEYCWRLDYEIGTMEDEFSMYNIDYWNSPNYQQEIDKIESLAETQPTEEKP